MRCISLALALAPLASAHMIITAPVPMGASSLTNGPLAANGADFPCKQRAGVYDSKGAVNVMALGSTQPLKFQGGATHGGGSCQISISYDLEPTASSTFKVIHSIEGGCPARNTVGNIGSDASAPAPDTYSFIVPSGLPAGSATLAWTWFNKVGNREMYMNCARIQLTGTTTKRDGLDARELAARDQAFFSALPDMFVANIGNGCGTKDSTDVIFPNPGSSLEQLGLSTSSALSAPTGTCQAAKAAAGGGKSIAAVAAATNQPAATASASNVIGGAQATVKPGVFATVAASASGTQPTATVKASVGVKSGACSPEGQWNCISGTSFQRCASGAWSVAMPVAGGTVCSPIGLSDAMAIGFASRPRANRQRRHEHLRRHLEMSS